MHQPIYGHYVARMRRGAAHITSDEMYRWLWQRIRAAFPHAIAATLMPDHLHLVARIELHLRRRLAAILGAFARTFGLGEIWLPVPDPQPLTKDKLPRAVRYLALNPCRPWSGNPPLVSDPLAWPWSTHRDVVGAVVDPWVDARKLALALRWDEHDFVPSFHRYVSSDPYVSVDGTPLPGLTAASQLPAQPLTEIIGAAASATRSPTSAIGRRGPTRRLFIALARRQGWRTWPLIAAACDMHPSSARQSAELCAEDWLSAGAMSLSLNCSTSNSQNASVRGGTKDVRR